MTVRQMTINDIGHLKLQEERMKERYKQYLEADVGPAWLMEDESGPL